MNCPTAKEQAEEQGSQGNSYRRGKNEAKRNPKNMQYSQDPQWQANMNVLLALTSSLLVGFEIVGYKLPTSKTWKERCKRKVEEANRTNISGS
jgi:hypothetical protein